MNASPPRPRQHLLVVAVVAPLVVVFVTLVAGALLAPDFGTSIAVHWGLAGEADGTAPAWAVLVGFAVVAPLLVGAALDDIEPGELTVRLKVLAVLPLWLSGLLGTLLLWMFATRTDSIGPGVGIALGSAVAFALAGLAWVLAPAASRDSGLPTGSSVAPLSLAPGERAAFLGTAAMTAQARLLLVLVAITTLGIVTAAVVATQGAAWPLYVVPVVVAVSVLGATAFAVRVDASGLAVRGVLGFPVFRVSAADIRAVRVVEVDPIADFGGWGLRHGTGRRFGVVTCKGEAVEVERHGGRSFGDAATAAGLLAAVAAPA